MNEIRDRIKAWRHALGLTQEEFARRVGIPKRTLVGYENGEREPGSSALAAIAKTGVNMTWLLTGEGEMLPAKQTKTEENQRDSADLDALAGDAIERWRAIMKLAADMPDKERAILLNEFFARAQSTAELAELRQAVQSLTASLKRA
ncbi:MAG: helix-turn-helix domain-containing protein [Pseudomonadota bacterium]